MPTPRRYRCAYTPTDRDRVPLPAGRRPTPKQIETLDTVWERATKRG